jgi:hypothetical protein
MHVFSYELAEVGPGLIRRERTGRLHYRRMNRGGVGSGDSGGVAGATDRCLREVRKVYENDVS